MSIFGDILNRIVHHASSAPAAQQGATPSSSGQAASQQQARQDAAAAQQGAAPAAGAQAQSSIQNVDVNAVLSQLAAKKGGGGNWRTSIVDMLKLLDMDSSLEARKKLADELDVHAGAPGSAEENMALQKAVMRKIAENGGKVPDDLKH